MSTLVILCVVCVFVQLSLAMRIDRELDQVNKTEIRCYCNLPECITSSYMCKSEGLGCFSDILAFVDITKASHGCLDLLDRDRQEHCQNEPSSTHVVDQPRSLLLCCYRDLCNHVDSPETLQRLNDSVIASSLLTDVERNVMVVSPRLHHMPSYSNAEVWFRAATIAVPICGALILFLLIALAIKILQSDTLDDRVLASKLRSKQCGFSVASLNRPNYVHHVQNHDRSYLSQIKKLPFVLQNDNTTMSSVPFNGCLNRVANHGQHVNVLHSCQQQHKNEANAKLNQSQTVAEPIPVVPVHCAVETEPTRNLIDLHKSSSPCNHNSNIYQQEDCPEDAHAASALLPSNHKLTYKKPLVITWTDADIRATLSQ